MAHDLHYLKVHKSLQQFSGSHNSTWWYCSRHSGAQLPFWPGSSTSGDLQHRVRIAGNAIDQGPVPSHHLSATISKQLGFDKGHAKTHGHHIICSKYAKIEPQIWLFLLKVLNCPFRREQMVLTLATMVVLAPYSKSVQHTARSTPWIFKNCGKQQNTYSKTPNRWFCMLLKSAKSLPRFLWPPTSALNCGLAAPPWYFQPPWPKLPRMEHSPLSGSILRTSCDWWEESPAFLLKPSWMFGGVCSNLIDAKNI